MNKTKLTLTIIGCVAGAALLAMAFLVWRSTAAKTAALEGDIEEGTDGYETVMDQARALSRKEVYPCAASVAAIVSNRTQVTEWESEAQKLAARGDKVFEATTPPAFKSFVVADAKRLMALPGAVEGRIAKPDFAFGPFRDYIVDSKMPERASLPKLQRQWDDIVTVVELLATNGIAELTDVQVKETVTEEPKSDKRRRPAAANSKSAVLDAPSSFTYVFSLAAKPAAFVRAINALETSERFVVVDDFSLGRPSDVIAETLGGDEKKSASTGRAGRRRRAADTAETKEEAKKQNGIVTDPALDAPMTVKLTVSVYDFRSLEEEKTEEVKK